MVAVNKVVLREQIMKMYVVVDSVNVVYKVDVWFKIKHNNKYYGRTYTFKSEKAYNKAIKEWEKGFKSIKLELK